MYKWKVVFADYTWTIINADNIGQAYRLAARYYPGYSYNIYYTQE